MRRPTHSFGSSPPWFAPICMIRRRCPCLLAAWSSRRKCDSREGCSHRRSRLSCTSTWANITAERLRRSTVRLRCGHGGWHGREDSYCVGELWNSCQLSAANLRRRSIASTGTSCGRTPIPVRHPPGIATLGLGPRTIERPATKVGFGSRGSLPTYRPRHWLSSL